MRSPARAAVALAATGFVLMTTLAASASLPSTNPDATDMVNGEVRAIAQVGGDVWIGGAFTQVLDHKQALVQTVGDLAVFNPAGLLDTGVHLPVVTKTSGTATVYGLSLGPNGILYVAGSFDHVDGKARDGAAAIDPATGALLSFAPKAGAGNAVLATASAIYVGTSKLLSFQLSGAATPGYAAPVAHINASLRGHVTLPQFRDIQIVGTTLVATCQCDTMDDSAGTGHAVKAVVEVNAKTGNLLNWSPQNLGPTNAAFGVSLIVHDFPGTSTPTVYLAAGGNDFTAAYDFVSGTQKWKEDTSGSSQGITWFQNDLVVGGHFDWTAKNTGQQCGDNDHPNTGCYLSPHLVAMDPSNGHVVLAGSAPWNPGTCCAYNGVWIVVSDTNGLTLHVGGAFTRAGTATWTYDTGTKTYAMKGGVRQNDYARFTASLPG